MIKVYLTAEINPDSEITRWCREGIDEDTGWYPQIGFDEIGGYYLHVPDRGSALFARVMLDCLISN